MHATFYIECIRTRSRAVFHLSRIWIRSKCTGIVHYIAATIFTKIIITTETDSTNIARETIALRLVPVTSARRKQVLSVVRQFVESMWTWLSVWHEVLQGMR